MKKLLQSCVIAFAMYSKIPMPKIEWNQENMKYAFCFLPLVGTVIGAIFYLFGAYGGRIAGNGTFHAVLMMMIPVAVSGGIHLDGFLDTSDALSSYKSREEKLEILKDSHAGAFAVIAGACYFFLLFGVCAELTESMTAVFAVGFMLSRALGGLSVVTFRMAKKTGLAATFSEMAFKKRVRNVMIGYAVLCSAAMIALHPVFGMCAVCGAALSFLYYRRMAYEKFGGITGDLAGFYIQISELAMGMLMVFAKYLI